jgi:hypothetical protein
MPRYTRINITICGDRMTLVVEYRGTCNFISNTTTSFTSTASHEQKAMVARIEIGREEGTRQSQLGRGNSWCHSERTEWPSSYVTQNTPATAVKK